MTHFDLTATRRAAPTIAFDPGLRSAGLAIFSGGQLRTSEQIEVVGSGRDVEGALVMANRVRGFCRTNLPMESSDDDHLLPQPIFVYETMKVYQKGEQSSTNPDDLFQLIYVTGAVAHALSDYYRGFVSTKAYLPAEWKGQVPKDVHQNRIIETLNPCERARLNGFPASDEADAIGIGLKYLRRM